MQLLQADARLLPSPVASASHCITFTPSASCDSSLSEDAESVSDLLVPGSLGEVTEEWVREFSPDLGQDEYEDQVVMNGSPICHATRASSSPPHVFFKKLSLEDPIHA
jgi:hypothetical protein